MKSKRRPNRRSRCESLEARQLLAGDAFVPLAGDWDADGVAETAIIDRANAKFLMRWENNPGFPNAAIDLGSVALDAMFAAGDWNGDGRDTLGVYDPANHEFRLRETNDPQSSEIHYATDGFNGKYVALAGDWNGDGRDTPALWDAASLRFYFAPSLSSGLVETAAFVPAWVEPAFSSAHWIPFVGDWDGDGRDSLGIMQRASGAIYLQRELGSNGVEAALMVNGIEEETLPLAGDWSGSGSDALGFYSVAKETFVLKSGLAPGTFDTEFYVAPLLGTNQLGTTAAGVRASSSSIRLDVIPGVYDDDRTEKPGDGKSANDVSGDGIVSLFDALMVISILRDTQAGVVPEGEMHLRADVSRDGVVSLLDAMIIVQALRNENLAANTASASIGSEAEPPLFASSFSLLSDPAKMLLETETETLLNRAAAASASQNAIISIVDRQGRILGVRVEQGVLDMYDANNNNMIDPGSAEEELLVFAIDGSLAKARTAAFFANGDGNGGVGPLTSRTVRFISQSTVTQREIESNPNIPDLNSTLRGPGFVAPIGLGGHFPPDVPNTPPVDLFGIEHQSRDSMVHAGDDGLKGTGDDLTLVSRFNVNPAFIPMDQDLESPESYGLQSGRMVEAQSRGIATLPGGLPIYKYQGNLPTLVGGIGVFFPGPDGYATFEQGFQAGAGQKTSQRLNAPKVLESEWIAYAALGGAPGAAGTVGTVTSVGVLDGIPPLPNIRLPFGRIDLVGITLEIYGPHPTAGNPHPGIKTLLNVGQSVGQGSSGSGANQVVDPGPDLDPTTPGDNVFIREGQIVPEGWLVLPHASGVDPITAADVEQIIANGIAEAELVRAAIRLPIGSRTKMVFAVADTAGEVLGLYRMPDATVFSIDVALAKARNMAYFANPAAVVDADRVDDNHDNVPDPNIPAGAAFSNRTFRFLSEPTFPDGVNGNPGPYSILHNPSINPLNGENLGAPAAASTFTTVLGFDAFHPSRNMHNPTNLANQNGTVFFPGSTPLYKTIAGVPTLIGGLGVSGDGVDQDDVVTAEAQTGFGPPANLRADAFFVRGVRLPYQKFLRNPHG